MNLYDHLFHGELRMEWGARGLSGHWHTKIVVFPLIFKL